MVADTVTGATIHVPVRARQGEPRAIMRKRHAGPPILTMTDRTAIRIGSFGPGPGEVRGALMRIGVTGGASFLPKNKFPDAVGEIRVGRQMTRETRNGLMAFRQGEPGRPMVLNPKMGGHKTSRRVAELTSVLLDSPVELAMMRVDMAIGAGLVFEHRSFASRRMTIGAGDLAMFTHQGVTRQIMTKRGLAIVLPSVRIVAFGAIRAQLLTMGIVVAVRAFLGGNPTEPTKRFSELGPLLGMTGTAFGLPMCARERKTGGVVIEPSRGPPTIHLMTGQAIIGKLPLMLVIVAVQTGVKGQRLKARVTADVMRRMAGETVSLFVFSQQRKAGNGMIKAQHRLPAVHAMTAKAVPLHFIAVSVFVATQAGGVEPQIGPSQILLFTKQHRVFFNVFGLMAILTRPTRVFPQQFKSR